MVPVQVCALKHDVGNDTEHSQRDALLYHFQLDEVKGTAVFYESQSVGRHLTAVLKEGDAPREHNDADEGPVAAGTCLLQF